MKILILGAKGMLGHDLMKVFGAFWPLGLGINDLDITDVKKLTRKLKKLKPDVIINAAAYTDVDAAEKNKKLAQKINGQAVANLARLSLRLGAILIHFSTDYVFSGRKKQGYQESDLPETPLNNYGRSKLIGERQINKLASQGLKYYLIRTSWLFGPASHRHHHKNFVDTILKLAKNRKMIKVVNDQFGSPTYTYDLALAVKNLLINKAPYGIYHLTNSGVTTWYKFARMIVKLSGAKLKIKACSTKDYPLPAKRPKYSILINHKFSKIRNWKKALRDYLK